MLVWLSSFKDDRVFFVDRKDCRPERGAVRPVGRSVEVPTYYVDVSVLSHHGFVRSVRSAPADG